MPKKLIFIPCICLLLCGACSWNVEERAANCLYVRIKKNPTTLDPALIVDLDSARIAAKLYNGLVEFDKKLSPVPDIAESWTVSADGRTYTFKLRKGVRFFNGREVTAADFKYSFERVLNPQTRSPRTWVLSRIKGSSRFRKGAAGSVSGLRVRGPHELEIILDEPFAPFLSMLGLTTAYVVPREEVEKRGADYSFHGSGTGPFTLEQWRHNQFLILKANKNYWRHKPLLSEICYKIIPEDFTALVEFEKGDLDLLPEIMASEYGRYAEDPQWQPYIKKAAGLNTYYLGLNCRMPPFNDPRVRRALNFAIDREKILGTLMQGRGIWARGPLPPLLRSGQPPQGYAYSPESAKKLLKQAGYAAGFRMTIYQTADMENLDICQVIQGYLRDIGIEADIVQLEWSTFLDVVAKGEAQSFWLSWWADYPDEENFLFPLFHSSNWGAGGNRCRFMDESVDELILQAVKVMDAKKRRSLYREIEERIIQEAPWVFFWHKSACSVHQPWVKGYSMPPLAVMEKWDSIYLSKPINE
jgi:peptide/nickel transport system substrate-binding protein/oligopeptide transport system substrate-binding protein